MPTRLSSSTKNRRDSILLSSRSGSGDINGPRMPAFRMPLRLLVARRTHGFDRPNSPVGHGVLLPLIEPAGERGQEHTEDPARRARRQSLYHRPDLETPKTVGRAMRHYDLSPAALDS